MEIEELKKIKEQIMSIYNQELQNQHDNIAEEELRLIKKEMNKVDELMEIYQNPNIDYRVMKLERLYMQLMSGMPKEDFLNLTPKEEFEIFYNSFPNDWSFKVSLEDKLKYLEEAICTNKGMNEIYPNGRKLTRDIDE